MKCNRCTGVMSFEEVYYDAEEFWGWRCICCGEYIDDVVLANRERQKRIRQNKYGGKIRRRNPYFLTPSKTLLAFQFGRNGRREGVDRR